MTYIFRTFNTGRPYASEGQWITYIGYQHGVLFVDHTRMIQGQISGWDQTPAGLMAEYDKGRYEYPRDELAIAMIKKMQDMATEI